MKENWSERLKDVKSAEQGISGEVKEAELVKKRTRERARARKSRSMCVLVSSSFLIGQPELISPALGSSGQDWVGYCQKHNPLPCVSLRPRVTTGPPFLSSTLPSPLYTPCSDSPRAQSGNTLPADGIIIASK